MHAYSIHLHEVLSLQFIFIILTESGVLVCMLTKSSEHFVTFWRAFKQYITGLFSQAIKNGR